MTAPDPDPKAVGDLHARLRTEAAMRDSFRPAAVLASVGKGLPPGDLVVAAALSALFDDCSVASDAEGPVWTLRPAVRRKVMSGLRGAQDLAVDTSVTRALSGTTGFQPQAIRRLVRYAQGDRPPPAAVLARRLQTLERAGPNAPAHALVAGLRGALNAVEQSARAERLLSDGLFGRNAERAALRDWIRMPHLGAPVRCLHVSGLPGIGKSYLLQSVMQEARGAGMVTIWLDFDRSGLSVTDATAFFDEVSRQLGDALPLSAAALRDVRLEATRARTALSPLEAEYALPRHLLAAMGRVVAAQGRPVLIVLDTLEALRARGETAVVRLFDYLDRLVAAGVAPLSVLSAGQGDALDPASGRKAADIRLLALPDAAAAAYLAAQNVTDVARDAILAMAGGNPLLLKLGARADAGGLELADQTPDGPEAAGAYLYRALLSRLGPPLNDLAQASLVLHRMRPQHLAEIVAPAIDLSLDRDEAMTLFRHLAKQRWLVETEPAGGWLRHRSDIRAAFLPLLYRDHPALARRVNERAAAVLATTDPDAALYHRLQLTRAGLPLPVIDPLLATRLTTTMIAELPPGARNAMHRARGERSGDFRAGTAKTDTTADPPFHSDTTGPASTSLDPLIKATANPDRNPPRVFVVDPATGRWRVRSGVAAQRVAPGLVADLRLMLANGDRREATYLVTTALLAPFGADDPGAAVILAYLWLSGAWAASLRLWRAMGAPFDAADAFLARILREIDAEARFVTARTRLPALPPPPTSGRSALPGAAYDIAIVTGQGADAEMGQTAAQGTLRATALLAPWLPIFSDGPATRLAPQADMRRERAGLRLTDALPDALGPGMRIAALTPYVVPLTALASDRHGVARAAWLGSLGQRLPAILRLQTPWAEMAADTATRAAETPFDMLDLLAVSGVLADAAVAMALALNDAEVARVGVSVENWRRLSQGLWCLSRRPPPGWQGVAGVDAATAQLVTRLTDQPDDAARLIRLWCDTDLARARLGRRVAGRLPATGADARAAAALRLGLSSGLAAAVAVLPDFDNSQPL